MLLEYPKNRMRPLSFVTQCKTSLQKYWYLEQAFTYKKNLPQNDFLLRRWTVLACWHTHKIRQRNDAAGRDEIVQ